MIHTIEASYSIIWHDLTEDPTDLPKNDYYHYILCRDKRTGKLEDYFFYDYEAHGAKYMPEEKIWIFYGEGCYGDTESYGYSSYGIEYDSGAESYVDEFTWYEVVAWAEDSASNRIPHYIPQMFKEETKQ